MGVRAQTTEGPSHCVDERGCWPSRQLKLSSSYHLSLLPGFLTPSPTENKHKGAASVRSARGPFTGQVHLFAEHTCRFTLMYLVAPGQRISISIVAAEGNSVYENPEALCPYYGRRVMCWRVHLLLLSPGYFVHNYNLWWTCFIKYE